MAQRRRSGLGTVLPLVIVATAVIAGTAQMAGAAASPNLPSRPNIVFILTDDQRWDELSSLYMPNLNDDLIDHGIEFRNGFVSNPLCCPSRVTILTGLYSSHNGVWSNVPNQHGGWITFHDLGEENHTIATVLHNSGYNTGLVGKYMNGYSEKRASWVPPGWDTWNAFTSLDYYGPTQSMNGTLTKYGKGQYQTDIIGQEAVDFIRHAPSGQPFFLYWAPHAPHLPSTPLKQDQGSLRDKISPWRPPSYNESDVRDKPWYIQQIASWDSQKQNKWDQVRENMLESLIDVDRWVGNIVDTLQETGRLNNTMIVFTSDNGYLLGEHRWSGKIVPYDESIRVPWIVRWDAADFPEAGGTDDHLMANTDFATTFAHVAGTSMGSTDGSDFAQLASQPWNDGDWRTYFLIQHGGQTSGNSATGITYCGVRTENYMYAQYWNGFEELYDINGDSNELQNVASFGQYNSVLNIERDRTHQLCNPPPPGYQFTH